MSIIGMSLSCANLSSCCDSIWTCATIKGNASVLKVYLTFWLQKHSVASGESSGKWSKARPSQHAVSACKKATLRLLKVSRMMAQAAGEVGLKPLTSKPDAPLSVP